LHPLKDFVPETGVKMKPRSPSSDSLFDSPFSRNPRVGNPIDLDDAIPF
jgi:hypothetical protein